jgi:predicted Zn-ribbon and HTH transcriptional regulator
MSISGRIRISYPLESAGMVATNMLMLSRRERIQQLLKDSKNPLSVEDIIALLGERTDQGTIYEDLEHVAKSVYAESRGRERVIMLPPKCRACGFIFKALEKPKRPGKCPKCKSERVTSPLFKILEK